MPNVMVLTKIVGGFCLTFLVFLLGSWWASSFYQPEPQSHGGQEHDATADLSYVVEVETKPQTTQGAEGAGDAGGTGDAAATQEFLALYATADATAGAKVFGQCKACHKIKDGANSTGPHLYSIVGRQIAGVAGFKYSKALTEKNTMDWTPEHLNAFLHNPKEWAKGTKMSYRGLRKVQDRANIIAYLKTIGGE